VVAAQLLAARAVQAVVLTAVEMRQAVQRLLTRQAVAVDLAARTTEATADRESST
jgi:hypothetical protein